MMRNPRSAVERFGGLAGLIATAAVLCSCRLPAHSILPMPPEPAEVAKPAAAQPGETIRAKRDTQTTKHLPIVPVAEEGLPIPLTNAPPWSPPGIAGPWPHDEYLEDGGDRDVQVNIGPEEEIRGLEMEDTVAIYDNYDGSTCIQPSNRVCLYAPRFAAVRQVTSILENQQYEHLTAVDKPIMPEMEREGQLATTAIQPLQPEGEIGRKQPSIERARENVTPAISRLPIAALQAGYATYENLRVIRLGVFEESEKPRLLEAIDAAATWTNNQAVQVVLDGQQAVDVTGDQRAQATFRVDVPNHPCLRVIKVASTKTAKPGDIVEFTIRFDNMGDQAIEHVTLIDNLTTRLEYVGGTAQSSRTAEFSTEENDGGSLLLRWDFADPLPFGRGGLVRFHCRVR